MDNIYIPYNIDGSYGDGSPGALTAPYNLQSEYSDDIGGETTIVVGVAGIASNIFGDTQLSFTQFLKPQSLSGPGFSTPTIWNFNKEIKLIGFNTLNFSNTSKIYNLRQYSNLNGRGINAALYGTAYVQGGVKEVRGLGFNSAVAPQPKVINTRADQYVDLRFPSRGIAPPTIDRPNLSPRILYPRGILPGAFGTAWVQPNPSPRGFTTDLYGTAWVSHSPRYLVPAKVDAFQPGYPKIFDPTQKIHHEGSPHIPGGIFGDIAIKNNRRVVSVLGEDHSRYGDWSEVHSNLINVAAQSFDTKAFGTADIWNKTPSVIPKPFDSATFGAAFISDRVRRILGRGIDMPESQRFGKHTLTKPPELKPGSIFGQAFGNIWVSNKTRHINPPGLNTLQISSPVVWFRYRYVSATGINFPGMVAPKIEHGLRTLLAKGSSFNIFGTPIVWFRVRSIQVPSIFREFETNHLVGGTQHIRPGGFDAVRFGERIIPEIQRVYAQGFNSQGFSEINQIELHTRWVRATGFLSFGQQASDRYGTAKVWNKRQYITQNYDSAGGLSPGEFGIWTAVANRNRNIGPVGFNATRFGYHNIANKAVPLYPKGEKFDSYGSAMVAYRIRKVKPDAIEAPYMSGWGRIFNSAFVIAPGTGVHSSYGHPTVINTRREYRWVGAFESMLFGVPMVAFRIRSLNIESRYSIAPVYLPIPKVDLHTRYIEPIGPDLNAFGGPSLHIKWNIITTRWTHRELFGDPSVRNLTPELKQRGNSTDVFGQAGVRLQKQYYGLDGFGTELWGRHHIAYRDRSISVPGTNTFGMGKILVTKTGAPPYSEQRITLDWPGEGERPDDFEGNGIAPLRDHVGRPSLKTNVVFASGFVASAYGSHHLQSNGILLDAGIQEFAIGDHFIGLKNRTIQVPTLGDFGAGIGETRPSVSPHTIYAVMEAPAQAIQNHYRHGRLHYVNSDDGIRSPGEVFGNARVTLRHRQIYLHGYNYVQVYVGTPSLQLRKRYVRPTGINMFRMGWHSALDGSPQDLVQYNDAAQTAYGRPSVVSPYYGPQTVRVSGLNAFNSGSNRVEFFHRPVYPRAFLATAMGASRSGDTPYKPQGLWVGKPMPTIPTGFNAERFGNTTIGLRVRDVSVEGFDSFASELDISNFKGRLKVTLVKQPTLIEPQAVAVLPCLSETGYGIPDIKLKVHYIRPDGNSDQYRKGGPQ